MNPQDFGLCRHLFCLLFLALTQANLLVGQISGVKQETLIVECAPTCRHTSLGCDGCLEVSTRVGCNYELCPRSNPYAELKRQQRLELKSFAVWNLSFGGEPLGSKIDYSDPARAWSSDATQLVGIAGAALSAVFSPLRSGKQARKN